jgi:hypothetical protein
LIRPLCLPGHGRPRSGRVPGESPGCVKIVLEGWPRGMPGSFRRPEWADLRRVRLKMIGLN